jgi:uncharacterized protein with HEPN domain
MMEFRMSDVPLSDVRVADAVVRCLKTCGGAFDDLPVETREIMPDADWSLLRRGVGQIMGDHMHDLLVAVANQHPQHKAAIFGSRNGE